MGHRLPSARLHNPQSHGVLQAQSPTQKREVCSLTRRSATHANPSTQEPSRVRRKKRLLGDRSIKWQRQRNRTACRIRADETRSERARLQGQHEPAERRHRPSQSLDRAPLRAQRSDQIVQRVLRRHKPPKTAKRTSEPSPAVPSRCRRLLWQTRQRLSQAPPQKPFPSKAWSYIRALLKERRIS